MPPCPLRTLTAHPLHLLGGRAGRFIRTMTRPRYTYRQEFLSSLLQVKTGMPSPGPADLSSASANTVVTLTSPRLFENSWVHKPVVVPDEEALLRPHGITSHAQLEGEVRRTTREIFRGLRFTLRRDLLASIITPSFSANYVRSRGKLGTFGVLADAGFFGRLPQSPLNVRKEYFEERISNDEGFEYHVTGLSGAQDQFLHTYFSALRAAMHEPPVAEAVALPEALKVRVITKGPPLTQYCLTPLQKFMWRVLKDHPAFKLVGAPDVTADDLRERIGRLEDGKFLLSGDYSDATNQLDPRLSEAAWTTMCETCVVPEALRKLGLRALTGHLLVTEEGLMPQQWGQLMGSIISFPILCLVNAAVCRMAIEYDLGHRVSLKDAKLMVNGDDCLFPASMRGYRAWGVFGTMAGLSPSVGKVYLSRSLCNINSTTFTYDSSDDGFLYERVKLIRLGLVFGYKRARTMKEEEPLYDPATGARHRAMMQECPRPFQEAAHRMYLRKNREELQKATGQGRPWYVPECYGGVGLEPHPELDAKFDSSVLDKQIVTAMIEWQTWSKVCPSQPKKLLPESETRVHELALREIKRLIGVKVPTRWVPQGSKEVDGFEAASLDKWVLYTAWQDVPTDKGEAFKAQQKVLDHNRRTWCWYVKHAARFAWMTPKGILEPRRQIHDVHVSRETVPAVPDATTRAFRQLTNLELGVRAETEAEVVRGLMHRHHQLIENEKVLIRRLRHYHDRASGLDMLASQGLLDG